MKVFVTGSTGLLGNHLVRLLCERGDEVRVLVRSRAKAREALEGLEVEPVEGDLADIGSFASALKGCEQLFHAAAYFREYFQPGEHVELLRRLNVEAPVALVDAARATGVRVVVNVGASGTIGRRPDGSPGDEESGPSPLVQTNLYLRSKWEGEAALDAYGRAHGFPIVHVLPGWMFGPGDLAPTSGGMLVRDFLLGRIPGWIAGGAPVVDARDVARVMLSAAERGQRGRRFLASAQYLELRDILRLLGEVSGRAAPRLRIPYPLAIGMGICAEAWSRWTERPSPLSVEGFRLLRTRLDVRADRAVQELGATFRPFVETLRDTVAWFRAREPLLQPHARPTLAASFCTAQTGGERAP